MPEALINYLPLSAFLGDKPNDNLTKNLLIVGYSLTHTSNPEKEYLLCVQFLSKMLLLKKKHLFSSEVAEFLQ